MRRALFWFVAGGLAAAWVASNGCESRVAPRATVLADNRVVQVGDGDKVVRLDDGRVLVVHRAGDDGKRERVFVEGLPVPVLPGTVTTEARPEPPTPPTPPTPPRAPRAPRPPAPARPDHAPDAKVITGRLSATEDRAVNDAVARLRATLAGSLGPRVPAGWQVSDGLVRAVVDAASVTVRPVERDYGTVYEATIRVDRWTQRQAQAAEEHRRQEVWQRILKLGAILVFVLVCLAVVSGYIKTDEATRGYYTNRLRVAAAAAVGAAGVLIYEMMMRS